MMEKLSQMMDVMYVWTSIMKFLESSWGWKPLEVLIGSIVAVCVIYMPVILLVGWLIIKIKKIAKNL